MRNYNDGLLLAQFWFNEELFIEQHIDVVGCISCIIFIVGLRFIGGIVGSYEKLETSLRFIGGIVGSNEGPEVGLKFIGEIVGSDEEPETWIKQ